MSNMCQIQHSFIAPFDTSWTSSSYCWKSGKGPFNQKSTDRIKAGRGKQNSQNGSFHIWFLGNWREDCAQTFGSLREGRAQTLHVTNSTVAVSSPGGSRLHNAHFWQFKGTPGRDLGPQPCLHLCNAPSDHCPMEQISRLTFSTAFRLSLRKQEKQSWEEISSWVPSACEPA